MESLIGVLGVAVVTGVLGFAYKMVEAYKEQVTFYQQRLLPTVENIVTAMNKNSETTRELADAIAKRSSNGPS